MIFFLVFDDFGLFVFFCHIFWDHVLRILGGSSVCCSGNFFAGFTAFFCLGVLKQVQVFICLFAFFLLFFWDHCCLFG